MQSVCWLNLGKTAVYSNAHTFSLNFGDGQQSKSSLCSNGGLYGGFDGDAWDVYRTAFSPRSHRDECRYATASHLRS